MTGTESYYTQYANNEIMFHVSTLLPYVQNDPQQVRSRRRGQDGRMPAPPHPPRRLLPNGRTLARPARTQAAHRQRHCRHRVCRRRQAAQLFADVHRLPFSAYARTAANHAAGRSPPLTLREDASAHAARSPRHVHCGSARRDRGRPAGVPVGNPTRQRSCLQLSRLMGSIALSPFAKSERQDQRGQQRAHAAVRPGSAGAADHQRPRGAAPLHPLQTYARPAIPGRVASPGRVLTRGRRERLGWRRASDQRREGGVHGARVPDAARAHHSELTEAHLRQVHGGRHQDQPQRGADVLLNKENWVARKAEPPAVAVGLREGHPLSCSTRRRPCAARSAPRQQVRRRGLSRRAQCRGADGALSPFCGLPIATGAGGLLGGGSAHPRAPSSDHDQPETPLC